MEQSFPFSYLRGPPPSNSKPKPVQAKPRLLPRFRPRSMREDRSHMTRPGGYRAMRDVQMYDHPYILLGAGYIHPANLVPPIHGLGEHRLVVRCLTQDVLNHSSGYGWDTAPAVI